MKKHPLKLGLLGGGQLARMLALEAFPLGIEPWVFCKGPDEPAAQVTPHSVVGDPASRADLEWFFAQVDLVTFESEFLNADLLREVSEKTRVPLYPDPGLMGLLQDRLTQKQRLQALKVPTAPFLPVDHFAQAENALVEFKGEMVLKQRRFGYDGYGTIVIRSRKDLLNARERIESHTSGFIAEPFVRFKRELAVMGARSQSGKVVFLPLVESYQKDSRCLWVNGPIKDRRWASFQERLKKFLMRTKYVGVMGFELFDDGKSLFINELAPRVHNTGHYSLEALTESQFRMHIKAGLDLPFAPVALTAPGFAMMNLLGEGVDEFHWKLQPFVHLHWYGKAKSHAGRKMGHYTVLASSASQALSLAKKARKDFHI